ncbi:MAG: DUF6794 domain-containing protein [Candidatus Heritagella sp.]
MLMLADVSPCFPALETFLGPEKLEEFVRRPIRRLDPCCFGLGPYIRSRLLSPRGDLYRAFWENGFLHPDDMTRELIRRFHQWERAKRLFPDALP